MATYQCECCTKRVEGLTPRYVAVKKSILKICDTCILKHVTYDPADWIPDGDGVITCSN